MTTDSISNSDGSEELTTKNTSVTTTEARNRLKNALFAALKTGTDTLIDAPTSLGKTHQIVTTRWRDLSGITGGKPVIHVHQTTDARDDAIKNESAEVDSHVLKGRTESCPVARGDFDSTLSAPDGSTPSAWFDQKCDDEVVPFSTAHRYFKKAQGEPPCERDGTCGASSQWRTWTTANDQPRFDIIHVTQKFAFVNGLIEGNNVIFDEQPDFAMELTQSQREHLREATSNLLHHRSDGKYIMDDLMTSVRHGWEPPLEELRAHLESDLTDEWLFSREKTHRLAPQIGRAIASARKISEDRFCGRDGNLCVVFTDKGKLRYVHRRPTLNDARCVIGLDAHPTTQLWQANTVDTLERVEILTGAERRWWRRHERGLRVVQIGGSRRSHSKGWQSEAEAEKAGTIIRHLRETHGDAFRTAICGLSVKPEVKQMMTAAGIPEPDLMNYGGEKSRNNFEDEVLGLLLGCLDPRDEPILDWLALCELDAEPMTITTDDGEVKRKPGRGFTGPDADAAADFLASVRENHLAQSVGRYARNPDDDDSGATVYVWSAALPDSLTDDVLEESYSRVTETREEITEYVRDATPPITKRNVAEACDVSPVTAWTTLKMLLSLGVVTRAETAGTDGADEYRYTGGELQMTVELS